MGIANLLKSTALTKNRDPGAQGLLWNEPLGLAIDATTEGGTVYVRDTTSANNRFNEPLNGNFGSAGLLTNGGTSAKLCQWNDGTLHWSAHNLCLQSQTLGTTWTTSNASVTADQTAAPDGTTTADLITDADAVNVGFISQNVATVSGYIYTASAYAKAGTSSVVEVQTSDGVTSYGLIVDLTNGNNIIRSGVGTPLSTSATNVGNGWYRITVTFSAASTGGQVLLVPAPRADVSSGALDGTKTGTAYFWGAQFNRGPSATGYLVTTAAAVYGIPQQWDVTTNQFGIIIEPAATNLVIQSEVLDNITWTKDASSISANQITAPDGATTADKVTEDNTANFHGVHITPSGNASSTTTYTVSVYIKGGSRRYIAVQHGGGEATRTRYTILVDTNDGSIVTTRSLNSPTNPSASVSPVGNGWYRASVTLTTGTATQPEALLVEAADSSSPTWGAVDLPTYTGDATSNFYAWGAQIETGSVATTYIPTVAATVTRAADAVNCALSSTPLGANVSTFTMWAHVLPRMSDNYIAGAPRIIGVETTDLCYIGQLVTASPDTFGMQCVISTVQCDITVTNTGAANNTVGNKVGGVVVANEFCVVPDFTEAIFDTSGSTSGTWATMVIGYTANAAGKEYNGLIKQLLLVPRKMAIGEIRARNAR